MGFEGCKGVSRAVKSERAQSPPAPGPPLTTRAGSSRSSRRLSRLHPATQSRSAGAGAASQSAAASVRSPRREQPMMAQPGRKLFRPEGVSTDAQEATLG
ncbi:hypothetical protein J1605_011868 [Eschrichtius robustus]|uniref:Uncharacterized protein n=1 Tax=Eschrichtius robustus TaxID=9764 RepID=A0AB34GNM3_ESCRO|nr:hypothetical protein J1605_011868 [Eschrichtius robustus]